MRTITSTLRWVVSVLMSVVMLNRGAGLDLVLAQTDKPTIAVLELEANNIDPSYARGLTDRLRAELFESEVFKVIERERMEAILDEHKLSLTGYVPDVSLVEAGRLLAVEYMVYGSVTRIGDTYSVNVRRVDVETGEIVATAKKDFKWNIDKVMKEGMRQIAIHLAGLPPESQQQAFYKRRWFWLATVVASGSIAVAWRSQQGRAEEPTTGDISINETWSDWDK